MRIGIYTGRSLDDKRLRDNVELILLRKNSVVELDVFDSEEEFLCKIEDLDAVFVSIDLIAGYGCIQSRNLIIIAVGEETQYRKAFRLNANYFVAEPFGLNDIEEAVEIILRKQLGEQVLQLYKGPLLFFVKERNIEYIEAYNGYVHCIVRKQVFRKENSLSEIMAGLDNRIFFRISRQYAVNLMWIIKYENGVVYIEGKKIIVSRRRRKLFEKRYMEFKLCK